MRKIYPDENYRFQVMEQWQEVKAAATAAGRAEAHMVTRVYCRNGIYKWFDIHENTMENNDGAGYARPGNERFATSLTAFLKKPMSKLESRFVAGLVDQLLLFTGLLTGLADQL